jgi:3-methyladenine DNA glycosylase AlkD
MIDSVDPAATASRPVSAITQRATAFVAERRPIAEGLGRELAEHVHDPETFADRLGAVFRELADPGYHDGEHWIAPGLGDTHGVRWPLIEAVRRGFREATGREGTSTWLFLADRLLREPKLEARWFAFGLLERLVVDDTERAWQLLRRAAREAADWITVDALAHPVGTGIILEPYRWAELEQLVYSPSRWERRLVGSTIATIPFLDRRHGRAPEIAGHGLGLVRELIGDAEPDVQKALAWALRSMAGIDRTATAAFLEAESLSAAETADGHRAWVIRDALTKIDPSDAERIRERLAGLRRRSGASPSSRAADTARRFEAALQGGPPAEPPLT